MNLPIDQPQKSHAQAAIARSRTRQAAIVVVFLGLLVAAGFGYRGFRKKKVTVPVYTYASALSTAPGMVAQILVKSGDQVRKGELLAVMDFSQVEAEREAAEQSVWNAVAGDAQGNQAVANALPSPPGMSGPFDVKMVPVGKLPGRLPTVRTNNIPFPTRTPPQVSKPADVPTSPLPGLQVDQLDSKVKDIQTKIKAEQDAVADLQKSFTAEQDAATSGQDLVNSLTAVAARTKAESDKSATLLAEGVISAREASRSQGYAQQAEGQLEAARVHAAADEATLGETQNQINSTAKQIVADQDDLKKAQAAADDARKAAARIAAVKTSPTPPPALAPARPMGQFKIIKVPTAPAAPAAPPTPLHVEFLPPELEAQKISQAENQLQTVNKKFIGACIYAPEDGVVTRIAIRPGQMIEANTVAIVIQKR